ncbi:TPA: hypothetical protein JY259_004639 [Salmonella enterica subsp. enterica serovar Infantis]|nr:hypothetical protein [Salmonella enterica subsp. enterica serovar Infantis]
MDFKKLAMEQKRKAQELTGEISVSEPVKEEKEFEPEFDFLSDISLEPEVKESSVENLVSNLNNTFDKIKEKETTLLKQPEKPKKRSIEGLVFKVPEPFIRLQNKQLPHYPFPKVAPFWGNTCQIASAEFNKEYQLKDNLDEAMLFVCSVIERIISITPDSKKDTMGNPEGFIFIDSNNDLLIMRVIEYFLNKNIYIATNKRDLTLKMLNSFKRNIEQRNQSFKYRIWSKKLITAFNLYNVHKINSEESLEDVKRALPIKVKK